MNISFFVPGLPRAAGSKRAFVNPKTGKMIVTDANKYAKGWKQQVAAFARDSYKGEPLRGPIMFDVFFIMPRPKSHYRTGKHKDELKPDAPIAHTSKPDRGKLLRGTEDALTGIIWADDAQVFTGNVEKRYGNRIGAHLVIETLEAEQ